MIGVFDSGFGGLTIFREIQRTLPEFDYIYLGDNARAPYGGHSAETIYNYTEQAVDFLFKAGCELVILACNTASAAALRRIQQEYLVRNYPDRRVLGVIRPVVEEAARLTKTGRMGVIGTTLTVESGAFVRELEDQRLKQSLEHKDFQIFQQACPLLVPLIEEGWEKKPETMRILRHYLRTLKSHKIDILLLGCTHYPVLLKAIRGITGPKVLVLDPGKVVAESLRDYLERHPEMASRLSRRSRVRYLTTEQADKFARLGSRLMGKPVKAESVRLG